MSSWILWTGNLVGMIFLVTFIVLIYQRKRLSKLRHFAPTIGFTANETRAGIDNSIEVIPELLDQYFEKTSLSEGILFTHIKLSEILEKREDGLTTYLFKCRRSMYRISDLYMTYTIACFIDPKINLPSFHLQRKTILHKLKDLCGIEKISFPSNPKFSKQYYLQGSKDDKGKIRQVFSADILSYLENHPSFNIEGSPGVFLCYRTGTTRDQNLEEFHEEACKVFSLFSL